MMGDAGHRDEMPRDRAEMTGTDEDIVEIVAEDGVSKPEIIAERTGRNPDYISDRASRLVKLGLLKRVFPTGGIYELTEDGQAWLDQELPDGELTHRVEELGLDQ